MPEVRTYTNARGRGPVDEYIDGLVRHGERGIAALIARYVDLLTEHGAGLPMPYARIIDRRERIYELRPRAHRIAYAKHGGTIYLLHAWRKQTRGLDPQEADTARRRLRDLRERGQ